MLDFRGWLEVVGPVSISFVDDEGDGTDELVPKLINKDHPGAMPVYDPKENPPTHKRRSKPIFAKKK